jgi:hypothetical protein
VLSGKPGISTVGSHFRAPSRRATHTVPAALAPSGRLRKNPSGRRVMAKTQM